MAKISYTKEGGIIKWGVEDWLAGLHPQYTNDTVPARMLGKYLGMATAFDPYRNLGWATPGYNPTALTNSSVIDAVQVQIVNNGLYAYTIGGAKIHRITVSSDTITNDTAGTGYPHTIDHAHASETGTDLCIYTTNTIAGVSTTRIFYSFYDATDWDVGCTVSLSAAPNTFDDDFMSTAPATHLASPYLADGKSYPHPLKVGIDDILYIGDRNFVHAYDGNGTTAGDDDGKFFPAVLTLPKGYIITGFAKINPTTLVVFAYKENSGSTYLKGQVTAFFWDYLSLDPYKVVDIGANYVSAPFEYMGTIGCFTYGTPIDKQSTKTGQMYLWNGEIFELIASFEDKTGGSIPQIVVGGVDIVGKQIMWNVEGDIYSWGNNFGFDMVLNKITAGTGVTCGLLRTIAVSKQYASSGTTTSGGLESLNSNYYSGTATSSLVDPDFPMRKMGQVTRVRIKFKEACTGGRALSVLIGDEEENQYTILDAIATVTAGKLVYEREYKSNGVTLPTFDTLKILFAWTSGSGATDAPIIETIEVEYININIPVI